VKRVLDILKSLHFQQQSSLPITETTNLPLTEGIPISSYSANITVPLSKPYFLPYPARNFTSLLGARSTSAASLSFLELEGGIKVLVDVGWDESFDASLLKELEKYAVWCLL